MNRPSDVNEGIKLTQKYLSAAVKSHENPDGTASQLTLPGLDAHVTINACYIGGSGQHRAWKYLYYLTINGRQFGGHDRRDSFVAWAINKIKEVAPQGVAGVGGSGVDSDDPNAEAAIEQQVGTAYKSCSGDSSERGDATSVSDEMAWNRANVEASPADSQISQVSCGQKQSLCDDAFFRPVQPGRATTGIQFAGERAEAAPAKSLPSPVLIDSNPDTPPTAMTSPAIQPLTDGVIFDEHLALALDEGQGSSNAWRLHEHVQHGLDRLAQTVEGVLVRHKVVEPELAEVGQ